MIDFNLIVMLDCGKVVITFKTVEKNIEDI